MTLIISGSGLSIENVVSVARHHEEVKLDGDALQRMEKCRAMLERKM